MTLYFDYSTMLKWSGNPTGIPRTVYCLARAFKEVFPDVKFVGIDDQLGMFHQVDITPDEASLGEVIVFTKEDVLVSVGANWACACYNDNIRQIRKTGVRFYQLFYDVIPYLYPFLYEHGKGFGDYFGAWTTETLALCNGAFTISACSKKDIESLARMAKIPHNELQVLRLGEDFGFISGEGHEYDRFSTLKNFVLAVGTLDIRKNQTCLLGAYRLLSKMDKGLLPKLVLAGRRGWIDSNIPFQIEHDRDLEGLVEVVTDATDRELEGLYGRCLFTLFPALYEGWGLPVAESLKHGKLCISSDTSSMVEIAPHLVRFASPYSSEAWAKQIFDLVRFPEQIEVESKRIRDEYVTTRWTETATLILDAIFCKS